MASSVTVLQQGRNDSVAGGEFCSFTSDTWTGNEGNRSTVVARGGTFRNYIVELSVNNNTVDGATIRLRVNSGNGNQIVTVDQATGVFQDITNTDTVAIQDRISNLYTQGNNSISSRGVGVEFV